jgi:cytochrome o ubiquinol oxidase subunit 1
MLPVLDDANRPIGFLGRKPAGDTNPDNPKYLNPSSTPLYDKSRVLYGLDAEAIAKLQHGARAIVVEGPMDRLAIQLAASIRDRAALAVSAADPWNGRTLEWATASPPAAYNFAVVPHVHGIDPWWAMKQAGTADHRPARFHDIIMPDDSSAGVVLGAMSFVFAFAMIWQIWWLAAVGGLGMFAAVLSQTFRDHAEHRIPASEVEAIENRRTMAPALAPGAPT